MTAQKDYYEILGVARDADDAALKKAYRKLAKKYHPDTNAGNKQAEEKFKEVTEAYAVLSDKEKRKLYDQFGSAAFDETAGPSGAYNYSGAGPDGSRREYHFEGSNVNVDDILKNIFGGGGFDGSSFQNANFSGSDFRNADFGNGFGGFGGRGGRRRNYQENGTDLHSEITVSFDEAVYGCDKILNFSSPDGSSAGSTLKVHIPAGIDTGKTIRLGGKGMPGTGGGRTGDLLLKVNVQSKPGIERKGMDIYTTENIPFTTAVFGGETMVQTLYGKVMCKIRPGIQPQTKIRLKGKGIVSLKNPNVHGDQYVSIQIQVPKNLSEEARRKLKEFEAACRNGKNEAA